MAKAKQKQSKAKQTKSASVKLPTGYKVIGRAPAWDVEKHPVIQGVRGKVKPVTVNRGTDDEYTTETMIINDHVLGRVTVWRSAFLEPLFEETDDGDSVRVEFLGYGDAKKGQSAPKMFDVSTKS
jgi:hypothetical protein